MIMLEARADKDELKQMVLLEAKAELKRMGTKASKKERFRTLLSLNPETVVANFFYALYKLYNLAESVNLTDSDSYASLDDLLQMNSNKVSVQQKEHKSPRYVSTVHTRVLKKEALSKPMLAPPSKKLLKHILKNEFGSDSTKGVYLKVELTNGDLEIIITRLDQNQQPRQHNRYVSGQQYMTETPRFKPIKRF